LSGESVYERKNRIDRSGYHRSCLRLSNSASIDRSLDLKISAGFDYVTEHEHSGAETLCKFVGVGSASHAVA
jgi:hypothetical protein